MPSIRVPTLVTLFLAAFAGAQSFDPNSVPISERDEWCTNQKASCPLLCTQIGASTSTVANTCDPASLTFACVCDNARQPNASAFSQTIPYYICTETNNQCAKNCGSNDNCVAACRTAHPCGAQNPPRINATSTTTASASGKTAAGTATASGAATTDAADATGFFGASATSSAASSDNTSGSAPFFRSAETYGLIVVFVSFFAGFTIFL